MQAPPNLVNYRIALNGHPLPPLEASLFEYVLAGNGVFVRGERRELTALVQVASCDVRGLAVLEPRVELRVPRVPADILSTILDAARQAKDDTETPVEIVFHLSVDECGRWTLEIPDQVQSAARAKPRNDSATSSYARALLEVHSHVDMAAQFSTIDDRDEVGFRLYAVLGRIFIDPELRVRVGVYGYRSEIPARKIFDLPAGIVDAVEDESVPPPLEEGND